MLVENSLVAVVSLPAGVFQPYSGVKTSILILDKSLARQVDTIAFFKIENDGFALGAQRREIDKNDLPQVCAEISEYLGRKRARESLDGFQSTLGLVVKKDRISENGDYNLSGERYREGQSNVGLRWPLVPIGELCIIERGASPRPIHDFITDAPDGVNWIKIGDAEVGAKFIATTKERVTPEGAAKSRRVKPGDFILSNSMSYGRPYIMATDGCIHDGWLLLRDHSPLLDQDFLYNILGSERVFAQFKQAATGGVVNNLNSEIVRGVKIPLPPLNIQREIAAEIEAYQKVIDGARAVLDNYRPLIPIDPGWPMGTVSDICTLISGQHIDKEDYNTDRIGVDYLTGPSDFGFKHPVATRWTSNPKVFATKGDILITVKGSGLGSVNILNTERAAISRQLMAIRVSNADPEFLYVLLLAQFEHIQSLGGGAAIPGITREQVLSLKIPLPPLDVQRAIVAEIEVEQKLVAANRELISRFEQKVQATLTRIWGEEAEAK